MSMAWNLFDTDARRMKAKLAELEIAVKDKLAEEHASEHRLRVTLKTAVDTLDRLPIAGALIWKGRKDV